MSRNRNNRNSNRNPATQPKLKDDGTIYHDGPLAIMTEESRKNPGEVVGRVMEEGPYMGKLIFFDHKQEEMRIGEIAFLDGRRIGPNFLHRPFAFVDAIAARTFGTDLDQAKAEVLKVYRPWQPPTSVRDGVAPQQPQAVKAPEPPKANPAALVEAIAGLEPAGLLGRFEQVAQNHTDIADKFLEECSKDPAAGSLHRSKAFFMKDETATFDCVLIAGPDEEVRTMAVQLATMRNFRCVGYNLSPDGMEIAMIQ